MGRFLELTVKRVARIGAWRENPTKCLWRWEPDRRFNFFFNPPVHLCVVTYITEISLHVTLSNQSHSLTHSLSIEIVTFVMKKCEVDRQFIECI